MVIWQVKLNCIEKNGGFILTSKIC